jgi:hypothetical protein
MKTLLSAAIALAVGATLIAGCNQSGSDRVGERPGDRTPSASPSTTPPPTSTTPPPSTDAANPRSTSSPSSQPGSTK